jgi:hypothetical protein
MVVLISVVLFSFGQGENRTDFGGQLEQGREG